MQINKTKGKKLGGVLRRRDEREVARPVLELAEYRRHVLRTDVRKESQALMCQALELRRVAPGFSESCVI